MENKQLSLEDKVKPYLILANAFKYQILGLKKQNSNDSEKVERLNLLKDLVLNQMLNQITRKELVQNYFFLEGFPVENLKEEFEELDKVESLPMSKLVEIIKLNSLAEIKEQLEKAEKEVNNKIKNMDVTKLKGVIIKKMDNDYEYEKNPLLKNWGFLLTLIQQEDRNYLTLVDYKNDIEIELPNEVLPYLLDSFNWQLVTESHKLKEKLEKLTVNK